jgi:hypothetical protein
MMHVWFWLPWFVAALAAPFEGRQPQLAALASDVYVAFGRENAVFVAKSADGGATFAAPIPVATPGKLSLGMRRGPRIAATSRAVMVAAIAGERGGGADGDLLVWRSIDGGASWSRARLLNDTPAAAREGMHAFGANAAGLAVAAWLDLRERGTRIYAAVSADHGETWGPNVAVYQSPSGAVCECCHPSVAVADDGAIAIMFRNHIAGARDMYVTVSRDRGLTFAPAVKQGEGRWDLKACPMDGGDVDWSGDDVASVWRRGMQLFTLQGTAAEQFVADGVDPVLSAAGRTIDLAWTATDGIVLQTHGQPRRVLGPGRFASLLARPDRTVIAWEHEGRIHVQSVVR